MASLKGRRVLIGTPAHDWKADVRWIDSFGNTIKLCVEYGIDLRWLFPPGQSLLQHARNELVRDALKHGFDDLIFVDADQDWEAEEFVRLLSYDVDCVGIPIRKKDEEERYNVYFPKGIFSFVKHPVHDILSGPDLALGTGLIRFSRKALMALTDGAELYRFAPGAEETPWVFDVRPKNGFLVGEDSHVSFTLQKHGMNVWIDPCMSCGHIGQKRYEGTFAEWLQRAQKAA